MDLFNTDAANSWECIVFRNFLMEENTLDEVFFYLDCRDAILRGSQLCNNFGAADPIAFIRVNIAE